jgi:membrane protease YdiL (CAAX protease family)
MQTTSPTTSAEPSPGSRQALPLVLWLVLAAAQITISFAVQSSGTEAENDSSEPLYSWPLGIGSIVIYGIFVAITVGIGRLYPDSRDALGFRSFAPRVLWLVAGVVVLSLIVSAALEPLLHAGEEQGLEPERWDPEKAAPFIFNALVIVTVVPFAEELFYRGLGVHVFRPFGGVIAVITTGVAFGLAHGIAVALPALAFFGLLLGWLRLRTDSVWPCVIAHSLYNGLGVAAFFAG